MLVSGGLLPWTILAQLTRKEIGELAKIERTLAKANEAKVRYIEALRARLEVK
jgi:hypothetical protein